MKKIIQNKRIRFIIMLLVYAICGGFVGGLFSYLAIRKHSSQNISKTLFYLIHLLQDHFIILQAVISILFVFAILYLLKHAMHLFLHMNPKEDDSKLMLKICTLQGNALLLTDFFVYLSVIFIAGATYFVLSNRLNKHHIFLLPFGISFGISLLCFSFIIFIQNKIIKDMQKVNPEKKGSVFDRDFSKKWLSSCDEAEIYIAYQSAYIAFVKFQRLLAKLILLCFLFSIVYAPLLFIMILFSLLLFILKIFYHRACTRSYM